MVDEQAENIKYTKHLNWSTHETIDLIRAMRKQECLWNNKHKAYRNVAKKAIAWLNIGKEIGVPVEMAKRKLDSLMASYRRIKAKHLNSLATDPPEYVYIPSWIYWDEMNFIRNAPEELNEKMPSSDKDEESSQMWTSREPQPPRKRCKVVKVGNNTITSEPTKFDDLEPEPERIATPKIQEPMATPLAIPKIMKRMKEDDEHDAFGITVAAKLRKMDETQRLYAENIINQALYKGLTFQLTVQSDMELLQPRIIHTEGHHRQQHDEQHRHLPQQQQQQQQQSPLPTTTIYFATPSPANSSSYNQKNTNSHNLMTTEEVSEDYKHNVL